ncbi:hypothetical protein L228DRAFT_99150 [Xylona heveae TC161]|uniref:Uncharacterized protein n=1 Tax=Xylona heveae (strain CBS 132557 / TC161) TaxID=1328760 RepID=A0A165I8Z6_XYLHT|nr:hypothetical protein L228DRAFT_99150 [Xylona heveae TC161]KZF24560.1 hypothetical protein L228DRAFT_99150 [Xylona heveae TC161]
MYNTKIKKCKRRDARPTVRVGPRGTQKSRESLGTPEKLEREREREREREKVRRISREKKLHRVRKNVFLSSQKPGTREREGTIITMKKLRGGIFAAVLAKKQHAGGWGWVYFWFPRTPSQNTRHLGKRRK